MCVTSVGRTSCKRCYKLHKCCVPSGHRQRIDARGPDNDNDNYDNNNRDFVPAPAPAPDSDSTSITAASPSPSAVSSDADLFNMSRKRKVSELAPGPQPGPSTRKQMRQMVQEISGTPILNRGKQVMSKKGMTKGWEKGFGGLQEFGSSMEEKMVRLERNQDEMNRQMAVVTESVGYIEDILRALVEGRRRGKEQEQEDEEDEE